MASPTTNLFRLFTLLFSGDRWWIAYPKTGKRIGECSICSSPLNSNPRQINAAKIPETIIYFHKPVHSQPMRLIQASRAGRASSRKSTVYTCGKILKNPPPSHLKEYGIHLALFLCSLCPACHSFRLRYGWWWWFLISYSHCHLFLSRRKI